jgi:FMN phosphatase YigB (HAD superfamily)
MKNRNQMPLAAPIRAVCFDWGGTLMSEIGPQTMSMADWPEVQVFDGVRECLESLHGRLPLCIATNASISHHHHIRRALDRGGIGHYFSEIFCFMDIGLRKNQIGFWQVVQQKLSVPLSEIAMVGDSLEHDVIAPRSFGVQSVWLASADAAAARPLDWPVVTDLRGFASLLAAAPQPWG